MWPPISHRSHLRPTDLQRPGGNACHSTKTRPRAGFFHFQSKCCPTCPILLTHSKVRQYTLIQIKFADCRQAQAILNRLRTSRGESLSASIPTYRRQPHGRRSHSRPRTRGPARVLHPLVHVHEPQGYRYSLPDHLGDCRSDLGHLHRLHADGADGTGCPVHVPRRRTVHRLLGGMHAERSPLERDDHLSRRPDDVLRGDSRPVRRLRQLFHAAADRRAGHGVPADEQPVLLDVCGRHLAGRGLAAGTRRQ